MLFASSTANLGFPFIMHLIELDWIAEGLLKTGNLILYSLNKFCKCFFICILKGIVFIILSVKKKKRKTSLLWTLVINGECSFRLQIWIEANVKNLLTACPKYCWEFMGPLGSSVRLFSFLEYLIINLFSPGPTLRDYFNGVRHCLARGGDINIPVL